MDARFLIATGAAEHGLVLGEKTSSRGRARIALEIDELEQHERGQHEQHCVGAGSRRTPGAQLALDGRFEQHATHLAKGTVRRGAVSFEVSDTTSARGATGPADLRESSTTPSGLAASTRATIGYGGKTADERLAAPGLPRQTDPSPEQKSSETRGRGRFIASTLPVNRRRRRRPRGALDGADSKGESPTRRPPAPSPRSRAAPTRPRRPGRAKF